jgi:hypothetical protein
MQLRLFKTPYLDLMKPRVGRLLFEGKTSEQERPGRSVDFYLYVWITQEATVSAFQAVMDENCAVNCTAGSQPVLGSLSRQPLNRAVLSDTGATEQVWMRHILLHLHQPDFQPLLESIGETVAKNLSMAITLTPVELQYYKTMCENVEKG